jgi:hypothetical protein
MSRSLHITIDAATVSPSKAIAATARTGPLVCLTGRAFRDLADELGGTDGAMRHLLRVSENVQKPIAVNFETGEDTSRTVFLAPRSWTTERLQGWVAGHHETLAAIFGQATPVPEAEW